MHPWLDEYDFEEILKNASKSAMDDKYDSDEGPNINLNEKISMKPKPKNKVKFED